MARNRIIHLGKYADQGPPLIACGRRKSSNEGWTRELDRPGYEVNCEKCRSRARPGRDPWMREPADILRPSPTAR